MLDIDISDSSNNNDPDITVTDNSQIIQQSIKPDQSFSVSIIDEANDINRSFAMSAVIDEAQIEPPQITAS